MNSLIENECVGLFGARSLVGEAVYTKALEKGLRVIAFSRDCSSLSPSENVDWRELAVPSSSSNKADSEQITHWVSVAPIWVMPEYLSLLEDHGVRRLVLLSSTSRFTKKDSSDEGERLLASRLSEAEDSMLSWGEIKGVEVLILQPTLIYGGGQDKNISEIARFIGRFGFFPLLGGAKGLRQPIHAEDVAMASLQALGSLTAVNQIYNISGGETLSYRDMVDRVFMAMSRKVRVVSISLPVFRLLVACARILPRYRNFSAAMAERMNADLVFDHSAATRDFGFSPRTFALNYDDLPRG